MDEGQLSRIVVPVLMLVGTFALAFFLQRPTLRVRKSATVNNKRISVVNGHPELLSSSVIVVESDSMLQAADSAGTRVQKGAGTKALEERRSWVTKFGAMVPGEFAITSGGALGAKYLVQVMPAQDIEHLQAQVQSILRHSAEGLKARSVALPLFSSLSQPESLSGFLSACTDFLNSKWTNDLSEVFIYASSESEQNNAAQALSTGAH